MLIIIGGDMELFFMSTSIIIPRAYNIPYWYFTLQFFFLNIYLLFLFTPHIRTFKILAISS